MQFSFLNRAILTSAALGIWLLRSYHNERAGCSSFKVSCVSTFLLFFCQNLEVGHRWITPLNICRCKLDLLFVFRGCLSSRGPWESAYWMMGTGLIRDTGESFTNESLSAGNPYETHHFCLSCSPLSVSSCVPCKIVLL